MKKIIITIDGHSACGKSTLAKALANQLNYGYIDTGAMYRAVTFYFLENRINIQKTAEMEKALKKINITFKNTVGGNRTYLNGKDVEDVIRKMFVSKNVSHVAAISTVRKMVVKQQVEMGKLKGIVMEGRDIGTVVFPNAELKIFLTADENVRTKRRYDELIKKGQKVSIKSIKDNLLERDHIDSTRKDSPLKKAKEAVLIDNSNITQKEQLAMVLALSMERIRRLSVDDKKVIAPKKTSRQATAKKANQATAKNQKVAQKNSTKKQANKKTTTQNNQPTPQKRTNQATAKNQKVAQKNSTQKQANKKTTTQKNKTTPQKRTNQTASKNQKVAQKNSTQKQANKKTATQNTKPNSQKKSKQLISQNQNSAQQNFLKIQVEEKSVERKRQSTPQQKPKRPVRKTVQQKAKPTSTPKKKSNKPTPKNIKPKQKNTQLKSTTDSSTEQKKKKVRTKRKKQS